MGCNLVVTGTLATEGGCEVTKKELPVSELLTSEAGIGFSSLGLFSGMKTGNPEVNPVEFKLPFIEAASSATREERTDVSMRAEDVDAASLAATAAAAAFLSSSVVWRGANDTEGWIREV